MKDILKEFFVTNIFSVMEKSINCSVCYLQFAQSFHSNQCIEKCLLKSYAKIEPKRIPLFTGTELLNTNDDVIYNRRAPETDIVSNATPKIPRSKRSVGLKKLCLENPRAPPCLQALKKLRSSTLLW